MKLDHKKVVDTARELIEEEGPEKLTLQALAARLGVKAPSLYNHIDSIQALREKLALTTLETLDSALRDAALGKSREEALLEMAQTYRNFAIAHSKLYKAMVENYYGEGAVHEEGRIIVRTLYQVLAPYELGEAGTKHFARAFRSALHGFVTLEEAGFKGTPDAEESFQHLVRALIASLSSYDWGRQ